VYWRP